MRAKKKNDINVLFVNLLIAESVGLVSSYFARGFYEYEALYKIKLAPPIFIFPIAWTILFLLMGVAAYLVVQAEEPDKKEAVFFYRAQLLVGLLWSIFFFGLGLKLFSFVWLLLLLYLVVVTYSEFKKINKNSAKLLIPYIIWVIFAAYINFMIWYLN